MTQSRADLLGWWRRKPLAIAAMTGLLAVETAVVGPATAASAATQGAALSHIGGSVNLWAEWTSTEQQDFEAVLAPFEDETGISVNYSGKGSNMDTAIDAAVAGGAPPQVALVPEGPAPGTRSSYLLLVGSYLSGGFGARGPQLQTQSQSRPRGHPPPYY